MIVRKRKVSYMDILSVNKKFHLSSRDLKERKEIDRERARAQLNCLSRSCLNLLSVTPLRVLAGNFACA